VTAGKRILEHDKGKVVSRNRIKNHEAAERFDRPQFSGRRFVLALVAALVIALSLMATVAQSVWAAIELAYYRAASTNNAVFLEWATVRELDIRGFEILCKPADAPDTAYHPIGSRIALGSATSGATYNFDVTSGLLPGERYCFRLREITEPGIPGEAFDLCGYGLGLTPPPTPIPMVTVEVSIPVTLTPTIVAVTPVPGLEVPTLAPTVDPFASPAPTIDPFAAATPTVDPFAVPTGTPTLTPTPTATQFVSQLPTPTTTPQASLPGDSVIAGIDPNSMAASQFPATQSPLEEPTPTVTPTETATQLPTETPTETPTATATLTTSVPVSVSQSGEPVAIDPNAVPVIPDSATGNEAEATATPLYVVVTATPTPLPALVVAPTFTPWPTAVPTAEFALSNLLVPNTQNLMVGLLCLIFVSASGLGALGLVTSVLYMRSQTRRERLPGPVYDRRRY
jgi:hypothetical protein